ncbi:MAG: hypothetical protein MUC93_14095 [Bacteroidales bacterium]|jgi:hypothetical protein|nr:hypothetical protein [Bacteroidales bacterium]
MENKVFYELHRSTAIKLLLSVDKNPVQHTNLTLAEMLEKHFPEKERSYIVKEDNLTLTNPLTYSDF